MHYYVLKSAINTAETGRVYPQIQRMSPNYNYEAKDSIYALSRFVGEFPDFIPNLDYFILKSNAKLTDLLSNAFLPANGLLISKKFSDILREFKLILNKIYPAKVYYKKEIQEYYWLHIGETLSEVIDYKKTSFVLLHNYAHNIGHIEISSLKDYYAKKEKVKADNPGKTISIWAEKIYFTTAFDQGFDFFKIGIFDTDFYISEKLKRILSKEGITGFDTEVAHKIIV